MNGSTRQLALPKPGPALKVVLLVLFVVGAAQSLLSDGPIARQLLALFGCDPLRVAHGEVWRLLTAGLLGDPRSIGPLLFTLMGLYFFATELETLWGGARFVRFLVWSTLASNAIAVAVDLIAPGDLPMLHAGYPLVGGYAMTTAVIIAWSRINAKTPVRLFYLVPMTGRTIFWLTVAMCAWCLYRPGSEGPVAPLGGVAAGMALAGSPSPLRRAYLKLKLRWLQARGVDSRRTPTAHEIAFGKAPSSRRPRTGGPVLRVVPGGKDDESDKPKDKRYLN
jgi:membrane associated rhomboid family serine protease